jgi:hypothetical protein
LSTLPTRCYIIIVKVSPESDCHLDIARTPIVELMLLFPTHTPHTHTHFGGLFCRHHPDSLQDPWCSSWHEGTGYVPRQVGAVLPPEGVQNAPGEVWWNVK